MRNRTLTVLMMLFTLLGAPLAQAAPGDRGNGHGNSHDQGHGNDRGNHGKQQKKHHQKQHHQQANRGHQWRRGDHVPRQYYSDKRYWVQDWRGRNLSAPPRGHRWLNIDGRYVLAAVAGGAITAIILNH
jgi:Ni/Co efflux regulator RcnB